MRPEERLPTNRTESIGSRVPPAVTSTCLSSSERDCRSIASALRDDLLRLGHAADADLALGELAARRPDDLDAAREQQLVVRTRRRVLPHPRVHGGCDEDRAVVGEHGLGERVVGQAVGEARHRVRRQRRDDEQIGALEMRIRVGGSRRSRERVERLGGDEALGAARRQRQHVMAGANEQADDLARLVGRDPAGDAKDDARHRP